MFLQPPKTLPVDHLSVSSLNLWLTCREKWRRRYIDKEQERRGPSMILGSAVGGAIRDTYGNAIETGRPLELPDALDALRDQWSNELDRSDGLIDWDGERPGRVLDSGAKVLPVYHRTIVPTVRPIAVEREFTLTPPGVDWTVTGYFDVEEEDSVKDVKTRSRQRGVVSPQEAQAEWQPGVYLLARRAEGIPTSRFDYHSLVRSAKGAGPAPRDVAITETSRSDEQLDDVFALIMRAAAEIAWAAEYDVWTPPPPGAWQCSPKFCGFFEACRWGGLHRPAKLAAPRPARKPGQAQVMEAVRATRIKNGTTTAAKVAAHLGIGDRSAVALLSALTRRGLLESSMQTKLVKQEGTTKKRRVVDLRKPLQYAEPEPTEAPAAVAA